MWAYLWQSRHLMMVDCEPPKECSHFIEDYSVDTQDISQISSWYFCEFPDTYQRNFVIISYIGWVILIYNWLQVSGAQHSCHKPRQTDRRYQIYYLPCFDNKIQNGYKSVYCQNYFEFVWRSTENKTQVSRLIANSSCISPGLSLRKSYTRCVTRKQTLR